MHSQIKTNKGFTIIEVVLVLAIAGLIFLMVFVALPALQRSQRDTQRREDLSRVGTALTQYQTNNNGKLPGTGTCSGNTTTLSSSSNDACKLLLNYLKKDSSGSGKADFNDPNGDPYSLTIVSDETTNAENSFESGVGTYNQIKIDTKAKCQGESAVKTGKSGDYAILYNLEGSGTYCADNQ